MTFLNAGSSALAAADPASANIGLFDALKVGGVGYLVVFFGLILLMVVVMIIGKMFSRKQTEKKAETVAAPAPVAAPSATAFDYDSAEKPADTTDSVVKEWRVKLEEVVAEFDSKFKVYDFRLDESGPVRSLCFHLLFPRNYSMRQEDVTAELTLRMRKYDPALQLKIEFVHSYV